MQQGRLLQRGVVPVRPQRALVDAFVNIGSTPVNTGFEGGSGALEAPLGMDIVRDVTLGRLPR